jgi:RNA polymerase sigma factor (sigma-70 family)
LRERFIDVETVFEGLVKGADDVEDINATAIYISNYLRRSFPMVDRDDILQEIHLWIAGHGDKIEDWLEQGKLGENKLARSMKHAALRYAQKQKAQYLGYETRDLYYYELGLIKNTLGLIWDEEAWSSPPQRVEEAKVKHRAPSEGNNYAATLADISRAVTRLPTADQEMLRLVYRDKSSIKEVAEILDLTISATNSRLNRSVKKIQQLLGGEWPGGD